MVGTHRGAYTRFSFDITNYLKAENIIVVKCEDSLSRTQPRGKQRWEKENFGCWYTDTTGIWKTVWAEEVATSYLKSGKAFVHESFLSYLICFGVRRYRISAHPCPKPRARRAILIQTRFSKNFDRIRRSSRG